ncbi:MAG: tRNA pseudouridine(55) synthase TruB [Alphaproteobacteria bacterium]|nr:tRNA pseudouridine(55) synthase TruB [Alphaproteobacteria bacterium]
MARKRKGEIVNGWINLDKPAGMTSTQAVGKVRRLFNARKVGHAGTLDPLATGVLPIALGEATKTIPFVQDSLKVYSFTVTWGEQRDTDDAEGKVIATSDKRPSQSEIEALLPRYTGEITQIPPKFSAIKVDGQRAYDLARDGEEVELKARKVFIKEIKINRHPGGSRDLLPLTNKIPASAGMTETSFLVTCGKGTYVRALARDMAADLDTYGYISALRREEVGPFTAQNAISLDNIEKMGINAALGEALLPLETALDDIPAIGVKDGEAAKLRNGQVLTFIARPDVNRLEQAGIDIGQGTRSALATFNGKPVALVEVSGVKISPVRVLNV